MPPRTRSAARTTSVTTRASLGRIQSAQKPQVYKAALQSGKKRNYHLITLCETCSQTKTVTRASPKVTVQVEQKKKNGPARRGLDTRVLNVIQKAIKHRISDCCNLEWLNAKIPALIWRSARENHLGLPTCPDEVSEPQYAAMLFTKRCSTCGGYAPREMNPILVDSIVWELLVRRTIDVNRVTDSSLLSVIEAPFQARVIMEVVVPLQRSQGAGDDEALRKWRSERHSLVEAKRRSAEPLSTWLRNRDREQAKNRDSLKALRPLGDDPLPSDAKEPHHDNSYIEDNNNAYPYPDDPDDPDNPDDAEGVLVEEPLIRVPPDDAEGPPKPPGNDGGAGMPLFDAHPTLQNIYLRTWAQYAFNHATQDSVQSILESHKLALMANAQYLPQPLVEEIQQMPLTLRSLERRLGMDHSELIRIYPVCPEPHAADDTPWSNFTSSQSPVHSEPPLNHFLTFLSLLLSVVYCPGIELPVHNAETGKFKTDAFTQTYPSLWSIGSRASSLRACLLLTEQGYDHEVYDLCEPHEHLQHKHRWLRAEWHERNDIRNETGTTFTKLDRLSGFYAFNNAPIDVMHLVDLGLTKAIESKYIYKQGMLRKRFHWQPAGETPKARYNAFITRTIFPHYCSQLPTHAQGLKGRVKAKQRRLLRLIMVGLYFEAWHVGDSIPDGNIPCGKEVEQGRQLLEQVGTVFTDMNINLTPSFHAITHLPDHLYKYGSVYNTTNRFERANRMLINVNKNRHGGGEIEATMAKGFMRRVECYRYINKLQSIEGPTDDDIATTKLLLQGMRDAPEHEVQRGRLDAILAGDARFLEQEHIWLATAPAKVNFRDHKHQAYYNYGLHNVHFYGYGAPPPEGIQVQLHPSRSTLAYPHFRRYGVRYGSANHTRGFGSRYGYIDDQTPVIVQGIYESTVTVLGEQYKFLAVMIQKFVAPAEPPAFPWNHWDHILGIGAWVYQELQPVEAVPASALLAFLRFPILRCHTGTVLDGGDEVPYDDELTNYDDHAL
ncbi:Transposase family Tnp2 protein [Rhizoctonia solani]|uniref:Transposase family Tnp2 protein n=1 Tax=Rhizoctonia solani TaxID=456999 RepID=A0A8H8NZF7_9AGAM|nr:Transposase family Tnp2 protein [Rhizoctonia solani]QRW20897.1 Transposase family Tnp2 protein [Rhizoctonia solani]